MNLIRQVRCLLALWTILLVATLAVPAMAGQSAAYVMDARTGETLYAENADTRLNPASLTKMMTLYVAFQDIEAGHVSLDTMVTVSKNAAGQPPSRLGLKAGQKIALRYLIRAAAIKSANDAATAIGDALSGSPEKFAARMTRVAKQLGMNNSTFKNANGLTAKGHLSTARDMSILGRHLFYDFPQYYNLFSRESTDAGLAKVRNTNRGFLTDYRGADGIKTGYTDAAGFNLTASAERNGIRLIGTVFGANSSSDRTAKMTRLFDAAFKKAPRQAKIILPLAVAAEPRDTDGGVDSALPEVEGGAGKTLRLTLAVAASPAPRPRPNLAGTDGIAVASAAEAAVASMQDGIAGALAEATATAPPPNTFEAQAQNLSGAVAGQDAMAEAVALTISATTSEQSVELAAMAAPPPARQAPIYGDSAATAQPQDGQADMAQAATAPTEVVRVSTSGGGNWGITLGTMNTRGEAEKLLLKVQLAENATLGESLRKVVAQNGGYDANFFGLSQEQADLACRRLAARGQDCLTIGPAS